MTIMPNTPDHPAVQAERSAEAGDAARPAPMTDSELERYARHIVLREIGGAGQNRLRAARVLVVGAGGLGSPVLEYLAAAGVGTISVVDHDVVSLSNLQRQVLFDDRHLGQPKVIAAQERLLRLNPGVTVFPVRMRLDDTNADGLLRCHDLVLDGTDSFGVRRIVNRAAVSLGIPLVSGAIGQWEGQVSVFSVADGTPCYACVFPNEPAPGVAPSCAEAGVIGALPGIIGSMMATEAIKVITGAGEALTGQLLMYDALQGECRRIRLVRRHDCEICGEASGSAVKRLPGNHEGLNR